MAVLAATATVAAAQTEPPGLLDPPRGISPGLPPQPSRPAAPCTPVPGSPDTWEPVGTGGAAVRTEEATRAGRARLRWEYEVVVDPWRPCRLYRIDPDDSRRVQRSTDSGTSWETVLAGDRPGPDGRSFAVSHLYVPAPDELWVAEDGNGTAVVRSTDAGATWHEANGGLAGEHVHVLAFPPPPSGGRARTAYAVTLPCRRTTVASSPLCPNSPLSFSPEALGPVEVWRTDDAGATWQSTAFPATTAYRLLQAAVDPADPAHLFVAGIPQSAFGLDGRGVLHESRDAGRAFSTVAADVPSMLSFFAVRRLGGGLRLYVTDCGRFVCSSDDGGRTWDEQAQGFRDKPGAMRAQPVADPRNGDRIVGAEHLTFGERGDTELVPLVTVDGFASQGAGTRHPTRYDSPLYAPTLGMAMQADRFGSFYVPIGVSCKYERCEPATPGNHETQWHRWELWRYTPPAATPPRQLRSYSTGNRLCDDEPSSCSLSTVRLATCTVPGLPDDFSGGIVFDGHELLVATSETGPKPYQGLIRRVDPATCTEKQPSIVVDFSPATWSDARARTRRTRPEFTGAPAANTYTVAPNAPVVGSLAYDADRDTLFLSPAENGEPGHTYQGNPAAVWSVRIADPRPDGTRPALEPASLRFLTGTCDAGETAIGTMAYDASADLLTTCLPSRIGRVDAEGAERRPLCLDNPFWGYPQGLTTRSAAVGAPGHLYLYSGPGITDYNVERCEPERVYQFPNQSTTPGSPAQLACDPATFGPGGGRQQAPLAASVLWMREGATLDAYLVPPEPDRHCSLGTELHVTGPTDIEPGQGVTATAGLLVHGPGTPPAPGHEVAFTAVSPSGRRVGLGTAGTDGAGRATVPFTAAEVGEWEVHALFSGTTAYRPSSATWRVRVGPQAAPPPPSLPPEPAATVVPPSAPALQPAPPSTPPVLQLPQQPARPSPPSGSQPISQPQPASAQAAALDRQQQVQPAFQQEADTEAAQGEEHAMTAVAPAVDRRGVHAVTVTTVALLGMSLGWLRRQPERVHAVARGRRRRQ